MYVESCIGATREQLDVPTASAASGEVYDRDEKPSGNRRFIGCGEGARTGSVRGRPRFPFRMRRA